MSLAEFSRKKALNFILDAYNQADPSINTNTGSVVRSTVINPSALIYAGLFQEIEILRNLYLGNYANISEQDMDLLAGLVDRPSGNRATATLRLYTQNIEPFTLESFPYFLSISGTSYRPISKVSFQVGDFLEEDGEIYVNVPVISTIFGPNGRAAAGEINEFANLPVDARRVNNPSSTQGGRPRLTNAQFFRFLQNTQNDGSITQINGVRQYVAENFPQVTDIKVVPAGDDLMLRDEVWTDDGVNPNLERNGSPFAAHESIASIDFDKQVGRGVSAGFTFTSEHENKRIAIDGDEEKFRTILKVIDEDTIIYSGHPLEGSASAEVYGDGPHLQIMSDIYLYFPAVQIQSVVVDKRYFLQTTDASTVDRVYYKTASGFSYNSIPDSGAIVVEEGTASEQVLVATGSGTDGNGDYFELENSLSAPLDENLQLSMYDMSEISVGEDLEDTPAIYILQLDALDPLSFETSSTIERSTPGTFDSPGWYVNNTDPAEVFSTRESKKIILDEKSDNDGFTELDISNVFVSDSTSIFTGTSENTSGDNTIDVSSATVDWLQAEGREVTLELPGNILDKESASITGANVSAGAGTDTLTITGMNFQYDASIGYRDDIYVQVYDNTPALIGSYDPGEVLVYGDKLELATGTFSGSADSVDVILPFQYTEDEFNSSTPSANDLAWVGEKTVDATHTLYQFDGVSWNAITATAGLYVSSQEIETVILATDGSTYIEILATDGLRIIQDKDGVDTSGENEVFITADDETGSFVSNPIRVIYATHNDFTTFQTTLDEGGVQNLCKDTLARSFLPSLIDATVEYSGDSTSQQVFTKFVELINTATNEVEEGSRLRLDMSNIIAALDEEGLSDSIDVNFEVRVTNYLTDGEFQVRYINPSEETKQDLAVNSSTPSGEDRIVLKRVGTTADIPGRGKLFLGGNNPDTQEVLPYEAVVDHGDDTFTFVFRGTRTSDYTHAEWETATVTVRDYDPELEFREGAIFVPATNRPYVRQLVVSKT